MENVTDGASFAQQNYAFYRIIGSIGSDYRLADQGISRLIKQQSPGEIELRIKDYGNIWGLGRAVKSETFLDFLDFSELKNQNFKTRFKGIFRPIKD